MNRMPKNRLYCLLITAVFTIAGTPLSVGATLTTAGGAVTRPGVPLPRRQLGPNSAPATPWHTHPMGPHVFYGTITAISATVIQMQLRNGRFRNVDATAAIANGDYSGPLFIGKIICVDGNLSSTGLFTAAHVFRLTNLYDLHPDK